MKPQEEVVPPEIRQRACANQVDDIIKNRGQTIKNELKMAQASPLLALAKTHNPGKPGIKNLKAAAKT